jgi:iron complex outermembrane receptor protein
LFGSTTNLDNSSAGGWSDKSSVNYGLRSTLDFNYNLGKSVQLLGVVGGELQKTDALTSGYSMGADSTDLSGYNVVKTLRSTVATYGSTGNAFTQWTLKLLKDFSITAGVGYSYLNLSLEDRLWAFANNHPGNKIPQTYNASYNDMFSPSASLQKIIKENVSVYASYSVGYKAPVSSYFYIPQTGEINLGLKPEKGVQIELGTKGSLLKNKLFYTLAVFNTQFQNKMTTVTVQNPENTATLYSYIKNGGTVNNNGLEILLRYNVINKGIGFLTAVRPFANFTYSDFKYEDFRFETIGKNSANQDSAIVTDFSGKQVAGVPRIVFNLGIDAETKIGVYGNLTMNYRDAMYITSDEANEAKAYTILNAKLGYRKTIAKFIFDAYFGLNNITSTQYYYMVFVNQIPDAYIAAPNEINFFGGVNLKYNF